MSKSAEAPLAGEQAPDADVLAAEYVHNTRESLMAEGDVAGLMARARAYRSGTEGASLDLLEAYHCYADAAAIGGAEAAYAQALCLMAGKPVARDPKAALGLLRSAADAGYPQARMWLANGFEIGAFGAPDSEKADVWYRTAARAAGIDLAGGDSAALAALGAGRYADLLPEGEARVAAQKRARQLGYLAPPAPLALPHAADARGAEHSAADATGADAGAEAQPGKLRALRAKRAAAALAAQAESETELEPGTAPPARAARAKAHAAQQPKRAPISDGLAAFGFAFLFVAAAAGASYALAQATAFKPDSLSALPAQLRYPSLLIAAVMLVVGWLPQWFLLRGGAVLRATMLGALGGAAGAALWGMGRGWLGSREVQAWAFGAAAYLAAALVLALLGGAKPKPSAADARL